MEILPNPSEKLDSRETVKQGTRMAIEALAQAVDPASDDGFEITDEEINKLNLLKTKQEIIDFFNPKSLDFNQEDPETKEKAKLMKLFFRDVELSRRINYAQIVKFVYGMTRKEFDDLLKKLFSEEELRDFSIFFLLESPLSEISLEERQREYEFYRRSIELIKKNYKKLIVIPVEKTGKKLGGMGQKSYPVNKKYIAAEHGKKLEKIIRDTSQWKDEDFLERILPSTAKIHTVEEVQHFLNAFSQVFFEIYLKYDENTCRHMTYLIKLFSDQLGLDFYTVGSIGHVYLCVNIKNINNDTYREYRIDPTANQFSKKFMGWTITPRAKDIGENFEDQYLLGKTPYSNEYPPYGKNFARHVPIHGKYIPETVETNIPTSSKSEILYVLRKILKANGLEKATHEEQ